MENWQIPSVLSFSQGQWNSIKVFHNEANTPLITKIGLKNFTGTNNILLKLWYARIFGKSLENKGLQKFKLSKKNVICYNTICNQKL